MTGSTISEAAKAVVRRNTEELQNRGNFDACEELFAADFVDHTPQAHGSPNRQGARALYQTLRAAFPDFRAQIHWQTADGELVTSYKTYDGTHQGVFLGRAIIDLHMFVVVGGRERSVSQYESLLQQADLSMTTKPHHFLQDTYSWRQRRRASGVVRCSKASVTGPSGLVHGCASGTSRHPQQ